MTLFVLHFRCVVVVVFFFLVAMEKRDGHAATTEYPHPFTHRVTLPTVHRIKVSVKKGSDNGAL